MKKYNVRIYLHTFVDYVVEAENEKDAVEIADNMEYDMDQLLDNLTPDGSEDVEEEKDVVTRMREMYDKFVERHGEKPRFATVRVKDGGESTERIKLRDFDPADTENDIDDDSVFFYADGIDGLCNLTMENNEDFIITDILFYSFSYIGRLSKTISYYNDFCNNHGVFHKCYLNGNGEPYFFTEEHIKDEDMPAGLYRADIRHSDSDFDKWATIEPHVWVNHAATIISDEPFVFGDDNYETIDICEIEWDEEVL